MAKVIETTITRTVEDPAVQVTLTMPEAQALRAIMGRTTGLALMDLYNGLAETTEADASIQLTVLPSNNTISLWREGKRL